MTITLDTAAQLEALGLTIFDPHTVANPNPVLGDHAGTATGLHADDPAIDAQYYALIAPVMLAIDGRTMAPGFRYGLNVTNALQGRPRHWYMNLSELDSSSLWPASCAFEFRPQPGFTGTGGTSSFGYAIGLAAQAAICHTWAAIIRLWLAGNYPLAVMQP